MTDPNKGPTLSNGRLVIGSRKRPKGEPCFKKLVAVHLDATLADADKLLEAVDKDARAAGAVWFHVVFLGPGIGFRVEGWDHKPEGEPASEAGKARASKQT